jgi:hypothetical protein
MDSKIVSKQIRQVIWKPLRGLGFDQFTTRTARRYHSDRVDVLNFQSFSSYLAEGVGCTTFSFAVNLGCYFPAVPMEYSRFSRFDKQGRFIPEEWHCQFRQRLKPSTGQPVAGYRGDIWSIDSEGTNLESAMQDAWKQIDELGLKWFDRLSSPDDVIQILLEVNDSNEFPGLGPLSSPSRDYVLGYVAASQGKDQLASKHLKLALESGAFDPLLPGYKKLDYKKATREALKTEIDRLSQSPRSSD